MCQNTNFWKAELKNFGTFFIYDVVLYFCYAFSSCLSQSQSCVWSWSGNLSFSSLVCYLRSSMSVLDLSSVGKSSFLAVLRKYFCVLQSIKQSVSQLWCLVFKVILYNCVSLSAVSLVSVLRSLKDERSGLCHRSASSCQSSVRQDVQSLYDIMKCLGVNFLVLQMSGESGCPGSGLSLHQVLCCLQYSSKYEIQ